MPDLDDEYEEYLWGEASPRSFARKAKFGMKIRKREPTTVVELAETDISAHIPR